MRITTQAELDKLPDSFKDYTVIEIDCGTTWVSVTKKYQNGHVEARESSHVEARESSHVEAWGSSHVVAWESSHVVAWESSHVVAWGSSHVEAWGSSHVVAWESSHVVAWESSHVEAWGSSHVEAWESSHVVAWESSHVEAWGSVAVHVKSEYSIIELFGFAVAILVAKCKQVKKKSRTSSVVKVKLQKGNSGWLDREGITLEKDHVTIFKRVSKDFKTQEGSTSETSWAIGSKLVHSDWRPKSGECGSGKFHACSRPYFCDQFRSAVGDRYVALSVAKKDLYAWDSAEFPHKIGFRAAKVLHECDRFGNKT